MLSRLALVTAILAVAPAQAQSVDPHLLAGARAFRAQQYEAALSEFRLVQRAGGADLALYLGPTLYKLGRFDEARSVLARSYRSGDIDPVAHYYLGLCWYRLGLLRLARTVFVALDAAAVGPKLAAGAARFVAEIDARPAAPAAPMISAADALATGDPAVALDAAEEAFLRATPRSAERARAAALIGRLGVGLSHDPVARQASSELAAP